MMPLTEHASPTLQVATRHWGVQEVAEDRVVTFPFGFPGFPACRRFAVLAGQGESILWLQSVDCADVALPVTEAFALVPDYDFELSDDEVTSLGITDVNDIAVFVVVTVPGNPMHATANLLAPIVINIAARLGMQKVLQGHHAIQHPLFPPVSG